MKAIAVDEEIQAEREDGGGKGKTAQRIPSSQEQVTAKRPSTSTQKSAETTLPSAGEPDHFLNASAPRDGSKLALLIEMLRRADGATIDDLTEATRWLAHTTRAAITGLRKRGYSIARDKNGSGDSVYRIAAAIDNGGDKRAAPPKAAVADEHEPKRKAKRAA